MKTEVMGTDSDSMFELAPVSLWLEDYSALFALFAQWRAQGVTDLRAHLNADRSRVTECSRQLKILKVNRRTLELFGARDLGHLVANLDQVFRDAMLDAHFNELVALWDGKLRFASQTVNYSLRGERLDILVHGKVLPGHEADWSRVLVSIENITERTRARRGWPSRSTTRTGCSKTRRCRCGSKTSVASSGCSTTCARAASKTFASSPTCTPSSSSAACRRSASST